MDLPSAHCQLLRRFHFPTSIFNIIAETICPSRPIPFRSLAGLIGACKYLLREHTHDQNFINTVSFLFSYCVCDISHCCTNTCNTSSVRTASFVLASNLRKSVMAGKSMQQGLEALVTLHSDKKQGVMNVDALLLFSFLPVLYPCQ